MSERHNVVRFAQKCRFCNDRHEVWELCGLLPPLGGGQYAQAIEARRAEPGTGSVEDESAVAKPCAQSTPGEPQVTSTEETQALLPVTPELLPCPVCGNRAFLSITGIPGHRSVWCLTEQCLRMAPRETEAEAITAWNRRISHSLPGDVPVTLADGFDAEQDEDTFTIRFPDGYALTAWADGRLFVSNATAGFAPFETTIAALTPSALSGDAGEIQQIIAWLQSINGGPMLGYTPSVLADAIERGDHRAAHQGAGEP